MVEHTFRGDVQRTVDHELDDDELLDHVRNLAQEKLTLVEEIKQYANSESEVSSIFTYKRNELLFPPPHLPPPPQLILALSG